MRKKDKGKEEQNWETGVDSQTGEKEEYSDTKTKEENFDMEDMADHSGDENTQAEGSDWKSKSGFRLRFFQMIIFLLMMGLSGKLFFVQVVDSDKYISIAKRQQRISLSGMDERGTIYDRNGKPLTGASEEYFYLIRRDRMDQGAENVLEKMGARKLSNYNEKYRIYGCGDYHEEESNLLQEKWDAFILKAPKRYSEDQPAVHVVGYINDADGRGVYGLEKDFDEVLGKRKKHLSAVGDGANYIIAGMGIQSEGTDEAYLITTLDADIQKKAEELLKKEKIKGTMVVAEVASGEVLACASAPTFHPHEVTQHLKSEEKEFLNLATQALYPPGSVFKIVVAAAALEQDMAKEETVFVCKGYEEINGIKIKCSTGGEEGHKEITLRSAFAKSCNSAFIQLGQKIGAESLLSMARKMGFGEKALVDFSAEKKGYLPSLEEVQGAGIGNLSIGQGKLLVTPMQICQMTQIIANNGKSGGLKFVKEAGKQGDERQLHSHKKIRGCSEKTAKRLQALMEETVKSGTANNLGNLSAGGKTGSAEASKEGQEVVHGWFTGYVPAQNPKYVITVFVEEGQSGRASAVPLFAQMAEALK